MALSFPSIAMVTPSFQQGAYLSAAMQSVLGQNYPSLQYVVMDGGSTDGSKDIIENVSDRLHDWVSESDKGQYDAVNQGFLQTDAEIMGWLNSDDMQLPWTLSIVGELFAKFPKVRWLTTRFPMRWDAAGRAVNCTDVRGYSREGILRGETLPGARGFTTWPIQQESTFWRRSLWEEAGGHLDITLDAAADFDLWMRFARLADPVAVSVPLAGFRRHGDQKTSKELSKYEDQARTSFQKNGGKQISGTGRNLCRDRLPTVLRPFAAKMGLLHSAKIIQRTRDNQSWELQEILT